MFAALVTLRRSKTALEGLFRLYGSIDAAHAGETILVAKGGTPWARLVPLEPSCRGRKAGVLAGRITLPEEELAAAEHPLLWPGPR